MSVKSLMEKELFDELQALWTENNRVTIKKALRQLVRFTMKSKDVAFWPNAQIMYAFSFDKNYCDIIQKQITLWEKHGFRIAKFDDVLMAYILMNKTHELTNKQKTIVKKNVLDALSYYVDTAIPYRKNSPDYIYIDLLGMVPQFLIMNGVEDNNEAMVDWAVKQFTSFIDKASDDKTGLLYHAYNKKSHEKLGIIGWGRAMGWFLTGLSESILLTKNRFPNHNKELLHLYKKYLKLTSNYLRPNGGLSWQLQAIDGPLDSSATAMVLQSMCLIRDDLNDSVDELICKMMHCLDGCYIDGKVLNCSAECGGAGIYPQKYDSYIWSVAPYAVCKMLIDERRKKNVEE